MSKNLPNLKNKTFANKIGQRRSHLKKQLSKNCNENCSRKKIPKFYNLAKNATQFFLKAHSSSCLYVVTTSFQSFSKEKLFKIKKPWLSFGYITWIMLNDQNYIHTIMSEFTYLTFRVYRSIQVGTWHNILFSFTAA